MKSEGTTDVHDGQVRAEGKGQQKLHMQEENHTGLWAGK